MRRPGPPANLTSEYVFFNGERVARRDNPTGTSPTVVYYFSDHLKTTDIVTDATGHILNESDYYPWGGELQFANADSNHYKFTGKERDTETGLDYFGARYYSNGLGRFSPRFINRFSRGKQVASYLGLIPREYSSGGKQRLGGISKQGNRFLRMLLVAASQVVVRYRSQVS